MGETLYKAKTIILATGADSKRCGFKGEGEFTGLGVSYCATCDANFFKGLEIFVVGGGDAAVEEAIYLTKFASKVYIVHRRDELRAVRAIQERAFKNDKIEILYDSVINRVEGSDAVNTVVVENVKTGELTTYRPY